jgi:ferredoxin
MRACEMGLKEDPSHGYSHKGKTPLIHNSGNSMHKVTFSKSGLTVDWTGRQPSLLELGEAHGLDLPFGCRMGNCTACQQPLLKGEVDYPDGHNGVPETGNILLCCSQPKGDLEIDA